MNNQYSTVIAAISTAMSNSGIGIVRMSGVGSFEIADRIYKGKREKKLSDQKSHTIHYGYVCDGEEMIDEVLIMLMRDLAVILEKIPLKLTAMAEFM